MIRFGGFPTQRDRYRERLYRAIHNEPGIGHTGLGRQLGYLDASQRRSLLAELIAAGRIEERQCMTTKGRLVPSYWPTVPHENK